MAAGDGLISMRPTSISWSGTSAGINNDDGIDFTNVTSLSLNGVFVSGIDNYFIVANTLISSGLNIGVRYRLRSNGTDATGTDYVYQYLESYSTLVSGGRGTSQTSFVFCTSSDTEQSGNTVAVYGPALAQPTASRSCCINSLEAATLFDVANTHSLSTSYDGLTLFPLSSSVTGNIHVFGYEE